MAEQAPGTAAVSDRRTAPRGVLPRSAQTWLLAALAFGILAIIVVTGRPEPAPRPTVTAANQPTAPSPDRLRDYQDRLRVLDERSRQQALSQAVETPAPLLYENAATTPPPVDPLQAEKKRREYESLFASNVVVSRRPDGQMPGADAQGQPFVAGVYPLLQDETCFFLAVDFDKASWRDDAAAFLETCRHLDLPAALERSRSGRGGHVWFFFDGAVPAALARRLGSHVLTDTMERRPDIGLGSTRTTACFRIKTRCRTEDLEI